jgi:hypothetical protein
VLASAAEWAGSGATLDHNRTAYPPVSGTASSGRHAHWAHGAALVVVMADALLAEPSDPAGVDRAHPASPSKLTTSRLSTSKLGARKLSTSKLGARKFGARKFGARKLSTAQVLTFNAATSLVMTGSLGAEIGFQIKNADSEAVAGKLRRHRLHNSQCAFRGTMVS